MSTKNEVLQRRYDKLTPSNRAALEYVRDNPGATDYEVREALRLQNITVHDDVVERVSDAVGGILAKDGKGWEVTDDFAAFLESQPKPVVATVAPAPGSLPAGRILHSGTARGGTLTTITLDTAASGNTSDYAGAGLELIGGVGAGQKAAISSYDPTTKIMTIVDQWSAVPNSTTAFNVVSTAPAAEFPNQPFPAPVTAFPNPPFPGSVTAFPNPSFPGEGTPVRPLEPPVILKSADLQPANK